MYDNLKRFQIKFYGIVQGVGFRPFIYKTAIRLHLNGYVQNRSDCVIVEIECSKKKLNHFIDEIEKNLPPAANIAKLSIKTLPLKSFKNFKIIKSKKNNFQNIHIPPDISTCNNCLNELFNSNDRRYLYPFINCTNCGPRLTIIKSIPYDRENTSMKKFKMCNNCKKEYEDFTDRRFHAEPIACAECGPHLSLLPVVYRLNSDLEIIGETVKLLKKGNIIAIKGLGGFHLAADATNFNTIKKLRERKKREEKPFALMVKNINSIKKIAYLTKKEEEILLSPEAPITLLKKKKNSIIANNVSPNLDNYGIMLPYTPLHHILFQNIDYLVMTSGNISDEPICIKNNEALQRLKDIADYFLLHNRGILVRCDDSIATVFNSSQVVLRFSRGYSPAPIILSKKYPEIIALGGHLKNSICILKDNYAFLSPHIGDLDTPKARDFFIETISVMKKVTSSNPEIIAIDLHPDYFSSKFAFNNLKGKKIFKVQHHHAHIVSCMAENNLNEDVIGIACDGTGFGTDGKVWGGEIFIANKKNFRRIGHLKYFGLIGGEKAIKEIWRLGIFFLYKLNKNLNLIDIDKYKKKIAIKMIEKNFNLLECSSLGRLFDTVSSILGIRYYNNFEGQAAMELETLALKWDSKIENFCNIVDGYNIDSYEIIRQVVKMVENKNDKSQIALSFHFALINAFKDICLKIREKYNLNKVVLSGGCFQNKILTENLINQLKHNNFRVFFHSKIPPNDGGISIGQAIVAANICFSNEN